MLKRASVLLLLLFTFSQCKDKEVEKETIILNPEEVANTCQIVSNTRYNGLTYGFNYDGNKVVGMQGFSDFDTFEYDGVQLTRAFNSRDNSYEVDFEYDQNSRLTAVIFIGRDSQGRLFSNKSTLEYNSKNQIRELIFDWPTFEKVECFLNYDENGNILNISGQYNGRLQNLLINKSFDDKKSPYQNQKIGQVLTYFMIYGLLVGGDNLTYYINQNNVTACDISVNNLRKSMGYEYTYNTADYPTQADISINENNRLRSGTEYFDYKCGI